MFVLAEQLASAWRTSWCDPAQVRAGSPVCNQPLKNRSLNVKMMLNHIMWMQFQMDPGGCIDAQGTSSWMRGFMRQGRTDGGVLWIKMLPRCTKEGSYRDAMRGEAKDQVTRIQIWATLPAPSLRARYHKTINEQWWSEWGSGERGVCVCVHRLIERDGAPWWSWRRQRQIKSQLNPNELSGLPKQNIGENLK